VVSPYTARQVERIVGVARKQLRYWERLGLIRSRSRWGERFYTFRDLVALETIKGLTSRGVAPYQVRRALQALERQRGGETAAVSALRFVWLGRRIAVVPPGASAPPVEPLTGQFVFDFEARATTERVKAMPSPSAEEWFARGLEYDSRLETLEQAVRCYQNAVCLAPDWVEAHINLGAALNQLGELEEAEESFRRALELDAGSATAHFNLGCVLFELDKVEEAVEALCRAIELAPVSADAHLNLAQAYEKLGRKRLARQHWEAYLKYEPHGPWADLARKHLHRPRNRNQSAKVTAFPARS